MKFTFKVLIIVIL